MITGPLRIPISRVAIMVVLIGRGKETVFPLPAVERYEPTVN
jgi:hypothetical protein